MSKHHSYATCFDYYCEICRSHKYEKKKKPHHKCYDHHSSDYSSEYSSDCSSDYSHSYHHESYDHSCDKSVRGDLTVCKDLHVRGKANICKDLHVRGYINTDGDLHVNGKITGYDDLTVKGKVNAEGDLCVNGSTQNKGDLDVDGTIRTKGDIAVDGSIHAKGDLRVDGTIKAGADLFTNDPMSLPKLDGPYAVDHFQIGKDNVQLRATERWRVDQFINKNLDVTGVQTIEVDGIEYFGRMEDDKPVYLTYPLPLTMEVYVPSKRANKDDTFDFFPDETDDGRYIGQLSLESMVVLQGTHFWDSGRVEADYKDNYFDFNSVIDDNSLANRVKDTPIGSWTGLQGKFLLDDLATDAYNRLVAVKAALDSDLEGNAFSAYQLMAKIMGSYGVSVQNGNPNSVNADDRKRAYDLIYGSSNVQGYKTFKTYAQRHNAKSTKGDNDCYNPNYDFATIQTENGKVPVVIYGEPNSVVTGEDNYSRLASWGIAAIHYHIAYNFNYIRVPGKTRSAEEIINSGNCFPDIINDLPYIWYYDNGNYSVQADSATDVNQGFINTMGYQYDINSSHTSTTSCDFNRDIIFNVIESSKTATDSAGNVLSDYLRFNQMGVFGRSGGQMALNGAHKIESETPGSFICGIAHDIVLSTPYIENGEQQGVGDFTGGLSEELTFPGGMNYPVMFMEPEVDWYFSGYGNRIIERAVVGSRKTLQAIVRKTPLNIRGRSIFFEMALSGHPNEGAKGHMNDGQGYGSVSLYGYSRGHPSQPCFPNIHYDPVYGFKDSSKLSANTNYAAMTAMMIYYRSMLSTFENIRFNALNFLPFKFNLSPWDIPDAEDHSQWRKREFNMDVGGKFNFRIDLEKKPVDLYDANSGDQIANPINGTINPGDVFYYFVDITDPETEALEVLLEWIGTPLKDAPDLDIQLYNSNFQVVQVSYYSRPELIRYDLTQLKNRTGTYYIEISHFVGGSADYNLTVNTGCYKAIIDTDRYDGPELAVTRRSVNVKNIPTSSAGLMSGDIYSDGGVIKIVP